MATKFDFTIKCLVSGRVVSRHRTYRTAENAAERLLQRGLFSIEIYGPDGLCASCTRWGIPPTGREVAVPDRYVSPRYRSFERDGLGFTVVGRFDV